MSILQSISRASYRVSRYLLRESFGIGHNNIVTRDIVEYITGVDRIFELSKDVPGHIIELGTGRGRNAVIFGSLITNSNKQKFKNYFGFDTFEGYTSKDIESTPHLSENEHKNTSLNIVTSHLTAEGLDEVCHLYQGDIIKTLPKFIDEGDRKHSAGHLRVSLLYIDCNAYRPALFALEKLVPNLSEGAIIAVDECLQGGETRALVEFSKEYNQDLVSGSFGGVISAYLIWKKPL